MPLRPRVRGPRGFSGRAPGRSIGRAPRQAHGWALIAVIAAVATLACSCRSPDRAGPASCEVWVTRDCGHTVLKSVEETFSPGETVMDVTRRVCRVETMYGGGFVKSIDDLASTGRRSSQGGDWFYYVDGVLEGRGAAESRVADGAIVWWDYHDWSSGGGIFVAPVGAWPRPLDRSLDSGCRVLFTSSAADRALRISKAIESAGGECHLNGYAGEPLDDRQSPVLLVGLAEEALNYPWLSDLFRNAWRAGMPGTVKKEGLLGFDSRGKEGACWREGAALIVATGSFMGDRRPLFLVVGWDKAGLDAAVAVLTDGESRGRSELKRAFGLAITSLGGVRLPVDAAGGGDRQ